MWQKYRIISVLVLYHILTLSILVFAPRKETTIPNTFHLGHWAAKVLMFIQGCHPESAPRYGWWFWSSQLRCEFPHLEIILFLCSVSAQQQLKHPWIINTVFITKPTNNPIQATTEKWSQTEPFGAGVFQVKWCYLIRKRKALLWLKKKMPKTQTRCWAMRYFQAYAINLDKELSFCNGIFLPWQKYKVIS